MSPRTPEEVAEAVRSGAKLLPRGGGSKPALSQAPAGVEVLEMGGLAGIVEYRPEEFVIIALAGTPLSEVKELLRRHQQYLPFDPPLAAAGATLGGTVAAGLSGPMRHRFGGVRDFILGVRLVDGKGRLVRGGGKVVKNAAGFDLPKLMVGSLGQLGVLVELTFKVFPLPKATKSLQSRLPLSEALERVQALGRSPLELMALDLLPLPEGEILLAARIGGDPEAMDERLERLKGWLPGAQELDEAFWEEEVLSWETPHLLKVPTTPKEIPALEALLQPLQAPRRYLAGGQLLYLGWPGSLQDLGPLQGRALFLKGGPAPLPPLGPFGSKVKAALDPEGRFPPWSDGSR
jgi:glycolate oxidase FAD binding subunit